MISYRNAAPADAAMLADLGRRTFTETFGHLYDPEDLALFLQTHTEDRWLAELRVPDFSVRLVEGDEGPVGYAKLGPPSLPFEPRGPCIELRQFYVLKPWHGAGVSQELMRWALEQGKQRGAMEMYLSVFVDNHRARRFYERYGFQFVAPYAFMVGSHADEDHIMRLVLEG
jgi:GNAT superfamily N-acetyltransferase